MSDVPDVVGESEQEEGFGQIQIALTKATRIINLSVFKQVHPVLQGYGKGNIRIVCPNFGRSAQTSDIYLLAKVPIFAKVNKIATIVNGLSVMKWFPLANCYFIFFVSCL